MFTQGGSQSGLENASVGSSENAGARTSEIADVEALENADAGGSEVQIKDQRRKEYLWGTNPLMWPPMLLLCFQHLETRDKAISNVRALLVDNGLPADALTLSELVCGEGNMLYDLLVLPSTGSAFTAANAVNEFYSKAGYGLEAHLCYYPRLRDLVDIRNGRIPELSRRIVQKLHYHGLPREEWKDIEVQLVLDDGTCCGRGVCCKFEPTDSVDDIVLGDSDVGVEVLDVVEDLIPLQWKGSVQAWATKNVLHKGVSLFGRLRQHQYINPVSFYCDDVGLDMSSVQQPQEVFKDEPVTTVGLWSSICKDKEGSEGLPAECSKICQDAFHEIGSSSKALSKNDFREQHYGGLPFRVKLVQDDEDRYEEILDCLSNASSKKVLMKHLATANGFRLAGNVVERLKTLHKLNESGTDSALISTLIRAAVDMEMRSLSSIKENAPLEKQQENILDDMEILVNEAVLEMRRKQHQSLMKMLKKTEDYQIAELEEFVSDKFKLMNDVHKSKKETESVLSWLSEYIAKATDQVKMTHMMEKQKWEEQAVIISKVELQAARQEIEELVAKSKNLEEQALKSQVELQAARQETEAIVAESKTKCSICFEKFEGTINKKRNRNSDILRKRSCFVPCMHANMCSKCAEEAWEKYKKCPVCNTGCPAKPQPIFI